MFWLTAAVLLSQWPDTIPVLHLEFDQSQWDYACEYYWQDIYLPAQYTLNGFTGTCQFRIRGATSRQYPKKSIKVELPQGEFIFERDELNLNAEFLDRTRLRELISYLYFAGIGQTVPQVHLMEVVFNGESQGAYVSVEDVDGDFLLNTPLPDLAVIYKCADRYTTLDRVEDLGPYGKKTFEEEPWDDFILLLHWLRLCPEEDFRDQLEERFHYDDLLRSVAANVLIGHGSTYYHNYHLLLDSTGSSGRWRYITWDMDRTWGKYGPGIEYFRNSSSQGNRRNTLIWRMWCDPGIREELIGEIHRQYPMISAFASSGRIDSLAVIVAPLVEIDPYRDYSMDNFWGTVELIKQWPETRYENLNVQFSQWPLPFSIAPPAESSGSRLFTWQGAGEGCSWQLVISPDSLFSDPDQFIYQAFPADTFHQIPAAMISQETWLQVYATRNGTQCRASNGPVHPASTLEGSFNEGAVISEINYMSSPALNAGDWFEVANVSEEPLNLAGWSFRDGTPGNLTTVTDLILDPGECMVFSSEPFLFQAVFPYLPVFSRELHFRLSDNGETLTLQDPLGATVDMVPYSPLSPWPEAAGSGSTLVLADLSADNSLPGSWISGPFGGTPFTTGGWDPDWPVRGAVTMRIMGPVPSAAGAITLVLTAVAAVQAEVSTFDISGRQVLPAVPLNLQAGTCTIPLNTGELPCGNYFAVLRHMGYTESERFTITGSEQ